MKIDLDDLTINASLVPIKTWNLNDGDWEEYFVEGLLDGARVGHLVISRAVKYFRSWSPDFFFDLSQNPPLPKPRIAWKETTEDYRGNGISGRLIILANEFYRGKLGTTLYSDTRFVRPLAAESRRVWEKLEKEGKAVFEPFKNLNGELIDRWRMI